MVKEIQYAKKLFLKILLVPYQKENRSKLKNLILIKQSLFYVPHFNYSKTLPIDAWMLF